MDSLMDLFQAMFEERYVLTQSSDTPLIYIVLTSHPWVDCGYLLAAESLLRQDSQLDVNENSSNLSNTFMNADLQATSLRGISSVTSSSEQRKVSRTMPILPEREPTTPWNCWLYRTF